MKKIKLKEVCRGIIHITFLNYTELRQTCMRFEEAYENRVYRIKKYKKKFTKEDIKKWWKTTPDGKKHPYLFSAFNVPSYIFEYFYKGVFDPLDKYEQALLDTLLPIYKKTKKFYVIMTVAKPMKEDFRHEAAHGLYFVSEKYKNKVDKIMKKIPRDIRKKLDKYLDDNGYGKSVLADERHATVLADNKKDIEKMKINFEQLLPIRNELNYIFEEVFKENKK